MLGNKGYIGDHFDSYNELERMTSEVDDASSDEQLLCPGEHFVECIPILEPAVRHHRLNSLSVSDIV